MRVFILFAPEFIDWALAIARRLKEEDPSCQLLGVASGPPEIYERVAAAQDLQVSPLWRLEDLERSWLDHALAPERRNALEARIGADVLHRLVVADRDLGRGFISGGVTAETPLSRIARDPQRLDRYVFGLLDHVERALQDKAVDLVFCHSVADAPSLALGLMSQSLGIPFAQVRHTRIGSRVLIDTSPFDELAPVQDCFERIVLTNRFPADSKTTSHRYLNAARALDSVPDYLDYHRQRIGRQLAWPKLLWRLAVSLRAELLAANSPGRQGLRNASPLRQCLLDLKAAIETRRLLSSETFLPLGERPAGSFAFFPLHVDPEASTMVQSPMHTDQLSLVEAVAKSLPTDMPLLVKEHLPTLGRRPKGFYERLKALPRVLLASPFESGAALVREAALTTVVSSTAGWEAMLFGKPVVVMAYPPYAMVNDGFVHCPDVTKLPGAIRQALAGEPADERRLVAYVAAALACSFECPTEDLWGERAAEAAGSRPQLLENLVAQLRDVAGREPAGQDDIWEALREAL
ncbi:hypothetical protein [Pelagibius sp.]|uniref:hypothetical protein n=1 Tax=Pelagibius sp. TaxID=1931238 RepID=UPI00260563A1|nr:hypothetical protein [Pelagibius sp.]